MLRSILFMLIGLAACGCSGEPFSKSSDADASGAGRRGGSSRPRPPKPSLRPPDRVALDPPGVDVMLARRGTEELVALERRSGAVAAAEPLGGPLVDLAFDGKRAFAVVGAPEHGGSHVRAFTLGSAGFEASATSELFAPETRVETYGEHTLVLSEDMGTSWALLGPDLAPIAPSKLLVRPSGLFVVQTRLGLRAVALNPNLFEDGQDADELVSARFDSGWKVERTSFEASGRPDSRLAHQPGGDFAWVVRKHADGITFQIGKLNAIEPGTPPWFEMRIVSGATGALAAAIVDLEHEQLVALLSRGTKPGALAFVPLTEGQSGGVSLLQGAVETSPWFSRQMLLHAGGVLSVATAAGVEELALGQSGVEWLREYPELGGPLAASE